jgi:hypothetical protein
MNDGMQLLGKARPWVVPLGTTKSFFKAFFVKCIHNYKLLLFHVYQLHALIYGLNFIW